MPPKRRAASSSKAGGKKVKVKEEEPPPQDSFRAAKEALKAAGPEVKGTRKVAEPCTISPAEVRVMHTCVCVCISKAYTPIAFTFRGFSF